MVKFVSSVYILFSLLCKCLASDELVTLNISMPEQEWESLCLQSQDVPAFLASRANLHVVESPYSYFNAKLSIDGSPKSFDVKIRKKGFEGSNDYERPSLKLKFISKDALQIGFDQNLVLNNCKQDGSLVAQKIVYETFNLNGIPAPKTRPVKVTVNNTNLGIYQCVERVDKKWVEKNLREFGGSLFEGTICDFFHDNIQDFEFKYGNEETGRSIILQLCELIDNRSNNKKFLSDLSEFIDLDNFINHWALCLRLGLIDSYFGNQNNYFIYINQKGKISFIPWGQDVAFFKMDSPLLNQNLSALCSGRLANILLRFPEIKQKLAKSILSIQFPTPDDLRFTKYCYDQHLTHMHRAQIEGEFFQFNKMPEINGVQVPQLSEDSPGYAQSWIALNEWYAYTTKYDWYNHINNSRGEKLVVNPPIKYSQIGLGKLEFSINYLLKYEGINDYKIPLKGNLSVLGKKIEMNMARGIFTSTTVLGDNELFAQKYGPYHTGKKIIIIEFYPDDTSNRECLVIFIENELQLRSEEHVRVSAHFLTRDYNNSINILPATVFLTNNGFDGVSGLLTSFNIDLKVYATTE